MSNGSSSSATIEASPHAVVQLYDTFLLHVSRASDAARRGDHQVQFNEVMSANRIIEGLNRCLDMTQGGSLASSLRDMYDAVSRALLRSVGKETASEACERLIGAVRETRDAWATVAGVPLLLSETAA